jgi:hypothetical protein
MKVYVSLYDRMNDRDYEDSLYELNNYGGVCASWAEAIRIIKQITEKESYYYVDPEWDDTEYMMRFEFMRYRRVMADDYEQEPIKQYLHTRVHVASIDYVDDLYGNIHDRYYIQIEEI